MAIEMRSAFRIEVDGKPVLAGVFFGFLAVLGMYRSPLADNRLVRGVRHPHSARTTRVGVEGFSADRVTVDFVYDSHVRVLVASGRWQVARHWWC